MKKADISMQVIVLAIIALLILVILAFIFTGRFGLINRDLQDCPGKAKCTDGGAEKQCPPGMIKTANSCKTTGIPQDGLCCISENEVETG